MLGPLKAPSWRGRGGRTAPEDASSRQPEQG